MAGGFSDHLLVFAVLHHHVIPVIPVDVPDGKRPVSLTLDAGELIEEFCKARVGYVLHGHQHMPFVGITAKLNAGDGLPRTWEPAKGNLFVLGCGSTGAKREWLPPEIGKNTLAVYTPKHDSLEVAFYEFLPQVKPVVHWKGQLPLQNFYSMI
jgi:hypothetical protein